MDTIYAEATPPGRGGVSIIRLSGPQAFGIAADLAGALPPSRTAALRSFADKGEILDQGLLLRFDAGSSFTGDAVVEFHLHGAPVVVARFGQALRNRGARLAEAGEFTRRAFLAGRVDLTEVEGVSDLLAAETETQRRQAMRLAAGDLRRLAAGWRNDLVTAGALVAASIDFPEEDALDEVPADVFALMRRVADQIRTQLDGAPAAERVREGFQVAIIGAPNLGKSTLLNRLAGRDVAIVTELPGTTRDVLEFHSDIDGLAVTFLDTAGLRETDDRIEAMGVSRARARAEQADLRVHLVEDDDGRPDGLFCPGDILRRAKGDLSTGERASVSGKTGEGVRELVLTISKELQGRISGAGLVATRRQAQHLQTACSALSGPCDEPAEIVGERIRVALQALERLVGMVSADDYLDVVFSRFCIGK